MLLYLALARLGTVCVWWRFLVLEVCVRGLVHAWVGQIVTFFETAALAAPWAP